MTLSPPAASRTFIATGLAMLAFAGNSILCRLALGPPDIDPTAFTTIRLASGAVTLLVLVRLAARGAPPARGGDWISATALFAYAALFSFAYVRLDVGTGALLLFGLVQITMIAGGLRRGERPRPLHWIGLATALGGLGFLVSPGLSAPSPGASAMMAGSGLAWGVYSLRGRGATDPVAATTGNFVRSVPMVLVMAFLLRGSIEISPPGVVLAVASGAIASGLGYVIWYFALRGLTATRAASVQLTVPVIAALGGSVFLREAVTSRLLAASVLILGGVALTLVARERPRIRP